MPGFDILQQPFQYHQPVAPEVPVPDNTGAKIIAAGAETAVNAFLRASIARKQAELEQQQIVQRGQIAERQLAVDQDRVNKSYQLGLRGQNVTQQENSLDFYNQDREIKMKEDLFPVQKEAIEALTTARQAKAKRDISMITQTAKMVEEAGKDAEGLGLYDWKLLKDNPMLYAKNAYGFQQMWDGTSEPKLKATIKMFVAKAEQAKVKLPDKDGAMKEYSWAHVARDIAEKGNDSPFVDALQAGGYYTKKEIGDVIKTSKGDRAKEIRREPTPELRRMLEGAKNANFGELSKIKSKVPTFGQGKLPDPELSQAEQEAETVKRRIAEEPENEAALRQRFSERNPGSEDLLDDDGADTGGSDETYNIQ